MRESRHRADTYPFPKASQVALAACLPTQETWDAGLFPGSGRSSGGGHGNPLQYSYLDNPMDRGAWWATVCRVARSWTWLKRFGAHIHTHIQSYLTRKYRSRIKSHTCQLWEPTSFLYSLEYREKRKELRLRKSPGWDPKPCPRLIDAGQECQVE